ncbi:hypothetical protein [Janibacter melonis]|uniref:hypothetical protein n=1 Tax=Janibacter melonis TaxID=262209 RepID=UPI0017499919|nr:hypothetical protein [Janibacter melonis]
MNWLIPELYRPVYWIDRFCCQNGPLEWVDEMDFLGSWFDRLRGIPFEKEVHLDRIVMAGTSAFEHLFAAEDMFTNRTADLEIGSFLRRQRSALRSELPDQVAPHLYRAMLAASNHSPAGVAMLIQLLLEFPRASLMTLDSQVQQGISSQSTMPDCRWALIHERSQFERHAPNLDMALVRGGSRRWDIWARPEWIERRLGWLRSSESVWLSSGSD